MNYRIAEMMKSARSEAEEKFAKMRQKQKKAQEEGDKAKIARLRALRLAKEASDKDTLDLEAADKATAKGKTPSQ